MLPQQNFTQDRPLAAYHDALAAASVSGLPALIKSLDAIIAAHPGSDIAPVALETVQTIGILHPSLLPDRAARLEAAARQAAGNPALARVAKRLELMAAYFSDAAKAAAGEAPTPPAGPDADNSWLQDMARADAAMRSGELQQAQALCHRIIEVDSESPLLAAVHTLLGLAHAGQGDVEPAAWNFQRAELITPAETVYGRAADYLQTLCRFERKALDRSASLFHDPELVPIAGIQEVKEPRALHYLQGKFWLLDREQVVILDGDGKVEGTKPSRQAEDIALLDTGSLVTLTEDGIQYEGQRPVRLTASIGGKARNLSKLQSFVLDNNGDFVLLDQDAGVVRARRLPDGTFSATVLTPMRGRLLRMDSNGRLYLLSQDRRTVTILSPAGKPVTSVSPASVSGKTPSVEHFALDNLNHLYLLGNDPGSVQIFRINSKDGTIAAEPLHTMEFEDRPPFRDLRVLALSPRGVLTVLGKDTNTWVTYR